MIFLLCKSDMFPFGNVICLRCKRDMLPEATWEGRIMSDALKIIGAHGKRRDNDFYPTPPECTIVLLNFLEERFLIRKSDVIWEPACGSFAMVDVMKQRGYHVIGTDIEQGQDYLTFDLKEKHDWIITNPPFCLAKEFIERSTEKNRPFAMLLKSQYWHSAKRRRLFLENQPAYILPLTWRPDFSGKGASMMDMIWCVWVGKSNTTQYIPLEKPNNKG